MLPETLRDLCRNEIGSPHAFGDCVLSFINNREHSSSGHVVQCLVVFASTVYGARFCRVAPLTVQVDQDVLFPATFGCICT